MLSRSPFGMLILIFAIAPMATCRAAVFEAAGSVNRSSGSFSSSLDSFFNSTANGAIPQGTTQYVNESEVYSFRAIGTASSGNDGLKANASASVRTTAPIGNSQLFVFSTSTFAGAEWSDFIITGPTSPATVPISLNLEIDGTFATSSISTPSGRSGADSQIQITVINDDNSFGGFFSRPQETEDQRPSLHPDFWWVSTAIRPSLPRCSTYRSIPPLPSLFSYR